MPDNEISYGLALVTGPAAEPVLPADVRTWGRISETIGDLADAVLTERIKAARELLEAQCDIALITQTWALTLDAFPTGPYARCRTLQSEGPAAVIQLSRPPWQSITSVVYLDTDGASQTLSSALYRFDAVRGRLTPAYGQVWPSTRNVINAVTVTFKNGYGDAATACPAQAREAVLEIVEDRLKNRGGMYQIPAGTREKLWALWSGRL